MKAYFQLWVLDINSGSTAYDIFAQNCQNKQEPETQQLRQKRHFFHQNVSQIVFN